jgi:hypothetical protein
MPPAYGFRLVPISGRHSIYAQSPLEFSSMLSMSRLGLLQCVQRSTTQIVSSSDHTAGKSSTHDPKYAASPNTGGCSTEDLYCRDERSPLYNILEQTRY